MPRVSEPVIRVAGLRKAYGEFEAVRGLDLTVEHGEIFAFLGPNGAGKTTTVEILEGYRERSAGEVSVLGEDPARPTRRWRERIGIVLQQSQMHPELTVRETIELFAGYYPNSRDVAETIDQVGLTEKAQTRVVRLSGGQQRRLDVALALIGDPELLFLDEPTTGFDPSARRRAWDVVASLRDLGKTVFLTTHYMDEAQALADRVIVIARGRVVASGTPADLGGREDAAARISFRLPAGIEPSALPVAATEVRASANGREVVVSERDPVPALAKLTAWSLETNSPLHGLQVTRPSLEDVYLELTDTAANDAEERVE
jgi:ABC-2 type transport system ATP-binding protein